MWERGVRRGEEVTQGESTRGSKSRESLQGMGLSKKGAWGAIREAGENSGRIKATKIKESGIPRRR